MFYIHWVCNICFEIQCQRYLKPSRVASHWRFQCAEALTTHTRFFQISWTNPVKQRWKEPWENLNRTSRANAPANWKGSPVSFWRHTALQMELCFHPVNHSARKLKQIVVTYPCGWRIWTALYSQLCLESVSALATRWPQWIVLDLTADHAQVGHVFLCACPWWVP